MLAGCSHAGMQTAESALQRPSGRQTSAVKLLQHAAPQLCRVIAQCCHKSLAKFPDARRRTEGVQAYATASVVASCPLWKENRR